MHIPDHFGTKNLLAQKHVFHYQLPPRIWARKMFLSKNIFLSGKMNGDGEHEDFTTLWYFMNQNEIKSQ